MDAPKTDEAPRSIGERLRPHAAKIVLSLVIAAGFYWIFRRGGLPLLPGREAFDKMTWWAVPAYTVLGAVALHVRTYRWIYLLRPISSDVSPLRTLGVGFVGYAVVLFAPLRIGEVARPYLISQDGQVTFAQATGTVAAERIIDGLMVVLLLLSALLIATPLSPLPDHVGKLPLPVAAVPAAAWTALVVFGGGFVAMALFYWARGFARRVTQTLIGGIAPGLATRLTTTLERLADGFSFLPSFKHTSHFLRDTIAYWALNWLAFWVLLRGCGADASAAQACVTMGVIGIGSLIPSGPGFFGAFQLAAYCGIAMFFQEDVVLTSGAAFVFVSYTVQLALTLVSALVGFALISRTQPVRSGAP